jgi:hypothetical protein
METATATKLDLALPPLAGGDAFDYEAPEYVEHYATLINARDAIRKEMGRCAKSILTIGWNLLHAKKECGHGLFLKWITAEFAWSADTTERFMRVARVFDNEANSARVRNLEPTTLYLLSAKSTPEQVREKVLTILGNCCGPKRSGSGSLLCLPIMPSKRSDDGDRRAK